jgi:hypothetical protein
LPHGRALEDNVRDPASLNGAYLSQIHRAITAARKKQVAGLKAFPATSGGI